MKQLLKRFIEDEAGSPAVEYSMIATVIAVALIAAFMGLGNGISACLAGTKAVSVLRLTALLVLNRFLSFQARLLVKLSQNLV